MTERELDILCAQLNDELNTSKKKIKMLEEECKALRNQIKDLERQVYNGSTM